VWLGIGTRWTGGGAHIAYILAPDDLVVHPQLMLLSSATDRKSTGIVFCALSSHVSYRVSTVPGARDWEIEGQSKNIIRVSIYLSWVPLPQTDRGTVPIIGRINCCLRAYYHVLSLYLVWYWVLLLPHAKEERQTWRFRNFSFYPSITSTGLVRAYDSLETEKRFKEKRRKKKDRKKKEENWRKKFRAISRLPKIEEI
jgi:hypothetical protein